MKITEITPFLLRGDEKYGAPRADGEVTDQGDQLLLVRVGTDEGLVGWADVETLGPVAERVLRGTGMSAYGFRTIAEELIGMDPLAPEQVWNDLYVATAYYGRRGVAMHCMSAVDNCLWSIRAQAQGTDLAAALGGRRRNHVHAYASTLFRETPDDNANAAAKYVALGYRGVKFGWGGFGRDPVRDRDNLAAIRDVLPPDCPLMVDPGWYVVDGDRARARTMAETRALLETLSAADPYWVEDFVHPEQLELYRQFKREFPHLRFAAGEQQATVWDFRRLRDEGDVDILQPDLSRCGGLTVATTIRDEMTPQLEIVTHSWLTDLLHAYSLHFLATLPNATWIEFNVAQSTLSRSVSRRPLVLGTDGTVPIPETIGLGVDVDEDFVRARQTQDIT